MNGGLGGRAVVGEHHKRGLLGRGGHGGQPHRTRAGPTTAVEECTGGSDFGSGSLMNWGAAATTPVPPKHTTQWKQTPEQLRKENSRRNTRRESRGQTIGLCQPPINAPGRRNYCRPGPALRSPGPAQSSRAAWLSTRLGVSVPSSHGGNASCDTPRRAVGVSQEKETRRGPASPPLAGLGHGRRAGPAPGCGSGTDAGGPRC